MDWIRDNYSDKDVMVLNGDVYMGRATIGIEMGDDHVMAGVPVYAEVLWS